MINLEIGDFIMKDGIKYEVKTVESRRFGGLDIYLESKDRSELVITSHADGSMTYKQN